MTVLRRTGVVLLGLFLFRAVTATPEESANIALGLFHLLVSLVTGVFMFFDAIIGIVDAIG